MLREELGVYLTVISTRRAANVPKMNELIGGATWCVRDEEDERAYGAAGAAVTAITGSLCKSRNAALALAWNAGVPCLQLSDDLKKLERVLVPVEGDPRVVTVGLSEALRVMRNAATETRAMLCGVAPTTNLFYFNPRKLVTSNAFVVGDMILVKPCDLFFDEAMTLKEDYDYTLQHLNKYGSAARANDVFAHFAHRTNAGGAVAVRTPELEQKNIAILKKKWGSAIRDNPKRPNEILLRLPKR